MTARMKRRWEPAHTDYSVCLVGGAFAERHGGECDFYDGCMHRSREAAQAACDKRQARSKRPGERYEVREHRRSGGWVYETTIRLPIEVAGPWTSVEGYGNTPKVAAEDAVATYRRAVERGLVEVSR